LNVGRRRIGAIIYGRSIGLRVRLRRVRPIIRVCRPC
jgi:hypothetical protein